MKLNQFLASFCVLLALPFAANGSAIVGSVSDAGNIIFTPTSGPVEVVGLNIESAAGLLTPVVSAAPFDFAIANQPTNIVLGNLGSSVTLDSILVTSIVYTGDPESGDLTLQYGDASFQVVDILIVASTPPSTVPEPASIAIWFSLIGFVGWRAIRQKPARS